MICHQGTTHLTHQAFPKNQITLSFYSTAFKFKIAAENLNAYCKKNPWYLWWSWASIDCQGKGKNVMWKSKHSNVTLEWWFMTWGNLSNLFLRWLIRKFTTHYLHLLGIWEFCVWHCPMFSESNKNVPNSTKMKILITILLGAYLT